MFNSFFRWFVEGLVLLLAVSLLSLLTYAVVDSAGVGPAKTVQVAVEEKQVVFAQSSTVLVGRVLLPQRRAEAHKLHFMIDGVETTFNVEKKVFNDIEEGDKVAVSYGLGRLSHSPQVTSIMLVEK